MVFVVCGCLDCFFVFDFVIECIKFIFLMNDLVLMELMDFLLT